MICPSCGEEAPEDAKWCEACGHDLNTTPLPVCVSCGEREVAGEGYCLSCGHKQPAERDHMEFEDGPAVAVTDRGRRHHHNEDAVAIGSVPGGATVLVVCDGVSSTPGSAEASLRAAEAARDLLITGLDGSVPGAAPSDRAAAAAAMVAHVEAAAGPAAEASVVGGAAPGLDPAGTAAPGDGGGGEPPDVTTLLTRAVALAQGEASDSAPADGNAANTDGGPPSSTLVAVIVQPIEGGAELATAWVGDSRAYWIGEQPRRLSPQDHEIAGSLVRWLGADSIDPTPDIELTTVTGPGHVVVCSDGLWRYAAEPGELSELVRRLTFDGENGLGLASAMVDFANEGGGHDNISVALWSNIAAGDRPAATEAPASELSMPTTDNHTRPPRPATPTEPPGADRDPRGDSPR